jgi:hypothetical protein
MIRRLQILPVGREAVMLPAVDLVGRAAGQKRGRAGVSAPTALRSNTVIDASVRSLR